MAAYTDLRLALRGHGYFPLPLRGKRPAFDDWTNKYNTNPDEIRLWERLHGDACNTGALTKHTPALDVDLAIPDAVEAIKELIYDRFADRGYVLIRTGKPPKFCTLFRTLAPFPKITRTLIGPDSSEQRLEFLADGQQVVVDGIHPDTGKRYSWHGGNLSEISADDLPDIDAARAQGLVDDATRLLVEQFGYRDKPAKAKSNGGAADRDGSTWAFYLANLIDHDALTQFAAALIRSGLTPGAAVNFLRAQVGSLEPSDRQQRRFHEIPTMVESAVNKFQRQQQQQPSPLVCVDLARDPIPDRKWAVFNRVPAHNVTLLSGEGAVGKSILLLQLSAATVLAKDWLGTLPEPGPVLYLSCEDDDDEVCRRLELIAQHYQATRLDLLNRGLCVINRVGQDSILALPDRNDRIVATPLFHELAAEIAHIRPVSIVLDNAADVFAGNEISRAHTRQFVTLLRSLALPNGAAVILSAHPSLTGINTGTGLSGSTAWHNSVRARLYFKPAPDVDDDELRVLEVMKNNYGPKAESVLVRWKNGVYVPELRAGFEQAIAEQKVNDLFLVLLRRFASQDRNVSDQKSPTYAPALFADEPEAKAGKVTSRDLAAAMVRLFASNKLRIVTYGPLSRQRRKIVEAGS